MTDMKMEIKLTDIDDISPEKLDKVVNIIIKETMLESESGMKERSAFLTGRLMSSIKAQRTGKIITVGPRVNYAEHADRYGIKKSGLHGGQYIQRTYDYLRSDALPKIIDLVLAQNYRGGA